MKHLTYSFLILITISSCLITKDRHYIRFKEAEQNQSKEPIKNLLIVGMGKLPTRFFLDQITNRLISDFKKKGIKATYFYLGNDLTIARKQFDTLTLGNNCDAVMSFFHTDYAEVREVEEDAYMFAAGQSIYVKIKQLRYNQGFNIRLYEPQNLTKFFWGSSLNIDYEFTDPFLYQIISKRMFASLRKNNLCK